MLRLGIEWKWPGVLIEYEIMSSAEYCQGLHLTFPKNKFQPKEPEKNHVVFRVFVPQSYKDKYPNWQSNLAQSPFTHAIIHILASMGLRAALADAWNDSDQGYFQFWVDRSQTIYERLLPAIDGDLNQSIVIPALVMT